jgi:hypothetical protein
MRRVSISGEEIVVRILGIACAALILSSTASMGQSKGTIVLGFVSGNNSCAAWLANAATEQAGNNWIVGFWSGLNLNSQTRHDVGKTTDGFGIVALVKKKCSDDPTSMLLGTTVDVYDSLEKSGR